MATVYPAAIAAAWLSLAGCAPKPAAPPAAEAAAGSLAVRVLDRGRAPRRQLRPRPVAGDAVRYEHALTSRVTVGYDTETFESDIEGRLSIEDVARDGLYRSRLVVEGADVALAGAGEGVGRRVSDALLGTEFALTHDAQGALVEQRIRYGDPSLDEPLSGISWGFELMDLALPAEPVGEGARWEVLSRSAQQGAAVRVLRQVELIRLAGDEVGIEFSYEGSTEAEGLDVGEGLRAEIRRFQFEGLGEQAFDLAHPFAGAAALDMEVRMELSVAVPGERATFAYEASGRIAAGGQLPPGE